MPANKDRMMKKVPSRFARRRAFTLVEMMVVVAIIALLIAALLPAFSHVKNKARRVQALSMFGSLEQGIRAFQGESALGGSLPPSRSDNPEDPQKIANPRHKAAGGEATVLISGAHLLVQAMIGADGLGPPGFKDTGSGGTRDARWWNDTTDDAGGLYELDATTFEPKSQRYGAGYVDDKMRDHTTTLAKMKENGTLYSEPLNNSALDEAMFIDPWGMPVLYYRANRGTVRLVSDATGPGIYTQEDNALITGNQNGTQKGAVAGFAGLDLGKGPLDGTNVYHALANAEPAGPDPKTVDIQTNAAFDNTFTRFIHDPSKRSRNTPYNADSYLLISAGYDGRYGTEDDITNFETRESD